MIAPAPLSPSPAPGSEDPAVRTVHDAPVATGQPCGGRLVARGPARFAVYLVTQLAVFSLPPGYLWVPSLVIILSGYIERIGWAGWSARHRAALMLVALPALPGFPLAEAVAWLSPGVRPDGLPAGRGLEDAARLCAVWAPSLVRSARLALVVMSAAWLSHGMTPVGLRDSLVVLLRPLGRGVAGMVARAASLTVAFVPWTMREVRLADEAARLRGSNPRRHPVRHLAVLAVPVMARSLDKAAHGADALALRDPGFDPDSRRQDVDIADC